MCSAYFIWLLARKKGLSIGNACVEATYAVSQHLLVMIDKKCGVSGCPVAASMCSPNTYSKECTKFAISVQPHFEQNEMISPTNS